MLRLTAVPPSGQAEWEQIPHPAIAESEVSSWSIKALLI
jgi:hypothetical protein